MYKYGIYYEYYKNSRRYSLQLYLQTQMVENDVEICKQNTMFANINFSTSKMFRINKQRTSTGIPLKKVIALLQFLCKKELL